MTPVSCRKINNNEPISIIVTESIYNVKKLLLIKVFDNSQKHQG